MEGGRVLHHPVYAFLTPTGGHFFQFITKFPKLQWQLKALKEEMPSHILSVGNQLGVEAVFTVLQPQAHDLQDMKEERERGREQQLEGNSFIKRLI